MTWLAKIFGWARTRPWTWAVGAGVACGLAGYSAGALRRPARVETTTQATSVGQATSRADMTVEEHRAPVVVVERVRRRPAPGGGVVELTTRTTTVGPVDVRLAGQASGETTVATSQSERRVEERASLLSGGAGATVGYDRGTATFGGWLEGCVGIFCALGHGEGGAGGVWSARGGVGIRF